MDEHKTSTMTEFLRREISVWDRLAQGKGYHAKKMRKRLLLILAAMAAVVLIAATVLVIAPWKGNTPHLPDGGDPGKNEGGVLLPEQATEARTDAESEVQTEEPAAPDPYAYDFSAVPAGATPIVPCNIATKNHPVNQTDRVIDMQSVMDAVCEIPAPKGQISVLIIHTHTGEGYNASDALYLDADDEEFARSADGSDGVVAVGARIAKRLNDAGIGTIHCKTVFDGRSNRESYSRAAEAIAAFRMAYPSLVCVIDVHRSATVDVNGNIVRSLAVAEGQSIGQTQLICGMSAEITSKTNLALAMRLQECMNRAFPDSCAAVVCKEQVLNQDLTPFSFTLEIGSSGNTPKEALAASEIVSDALCALFDTD